MNKIWEKLKPYLDKLMKALPSGNVQDSMRIVFAYGALLFAIAFCLLAAWIWNGMKAGHFDVNQMLAFFSAATGAGPVAAVTFLAVFLVDKNKDGRPDAAEQRALKGGEEK